MMEMRPCNPMSAKCCVALSALKPGGRGRVAAVLGGRGLTHRLVTMGIFPGVEITLVQGGPRGPVLVDLHCCRLMFGHGVAERIMVEPLP